MELSVLTALVADTLKQYDSESPRHKNFGRGIGPFGEPQLVKELANRFTAAGTAAKTMRTPDLRINGAELAVEFKIVRPFGDNGREAENWSVNLLHPYEGNTSLLGDAMKLATLSEYSQRVLFVLGYEHRSARIPLDPLLASFELIISEVMQIDVSTRCEERREDLVHPVHQVLRCISWELT